MSPTVTFTPCAKCHAEISTDREACPHCGEPVPEVSSTASLRAENERLKALVAQQDKALAAENADLAKKLNLAPTGSVKVPAGWPTHLPYKDASGKTWNHNGTTWN